MSSQGKADSHCDWVRFQGLWPHPGSVSTWGWELSPICVASFADLKWKYQSALSIKKMYTEEPWKHLSKQQKVVWRQTLAAFLAKCVCRHSPCGPSIGPRARSSGDTVATLRLEVGVACTPFPSLCSSQKWSLRPLSSINTMWNGESVF